MQHPMTKPPLMKSLMTPFPYTIEPTDTLQQAIELMAEHEIHHLPVAQQGNLLGIISDRDIRWALDPVFDRGAAHEVQVESVYTRDIYTCELHVRLSEVLLEMAAHHYGCALVTKNGKLAGIFTSTDACREFGEYLAARFPVAPEQEPA